MASLGIEIKESKEVLDFVKETSKRLSKQNLIQNPFNGEMVLFKDTIALHIKPIYFNLPFYLSLFFGLTYLIFERTFLFIMGAIFLLLSLLYSKEFFYFVFSKGLRKKGYKGRIKLLSQEEIIKRLILWVKEKY